MVPPIIDDFSIFYESIIFIKRYYLMRNPKESFPSFIPEHFPITHNQIKNSGITQIIESNFYLVSN